MDCEYSKKYPDGQFIVLAKAECPDILTEHIPAPVAEVVPTPAASVAAPAPAPVAVVTEESYPVAPPVKEWQTIDRYQVKGGLVKDTETKLMWMRCSLGQTWDGSTCTGKALEYTWAETMKQNGFNYAGYSNWRVPKIEELKTLVYCSSGLPKTWNSDVSITFGDDSC